MVLLPVLRVTEPLDIVVMAARRRRHKRLQRMYLLTQHIMSHISDFDYNAIRKIAF